MSQPQDLTKDRLRTEARERRDTIPAAQRAQWSLAIAANALSALRDRVSPHAVVSAYSPMRSEVDPLPLAHALAAAGASLCLPAFVGKVMEFRAFRPGDTLVPAGFQTFEPPPSAGVVAPTIVLAPLLAFDRRGNRLGWGKGYYDAFLNARDAAAARGDGVRPFVVGIAFGCQEFDAVPATASDRRLDAVVTEAGYRTC